MNGCYFPIVKVGIIHSTPLDLSDGIYKSMSELNTAIFYYYFSDFCPKVLQSPPSNDFEFLLSSIRYVKVFRTIS